MTLRVLEDLNSGSQQCNLFVEGDITIYTLKGLMDSVQNHLRSRNAVNLNLSSVEYLDSTGIETLIFLKVYAENEGKDLSFSNISSSAASILKNYPQFDSLSRQAV